MPRGYLGIACRWHWLLSADRMTLSVLIPHFSDQNHGRGCRRPGRGKNLSAFVGSDQGDLVLRVSFNASGAAPLQSYKA